MGLCSGISLSHDDPNRFDRSQWCPIGRVSFLYVLFRLLMCCLYIFGVGFSMALYPDHPFGKWFVFMTNQGYLCLTLHFILEFCLVAHRYIRERRSGEPEPMPTMPFIFKLSWALGSCFYTVAISITVIYWGLLHKQAVARGVVDTPLKMAVSVYFHGLNSGFLLLDILVSDRPWRALHFVYPMLFGLVYVSFSVVYWLAGGVGVCSPKDGCYPFIYPILDWGGKPGLAGITIALGLVSLPVVHQFWFGLHKARRWLAGKERTEAKPQDRPTRPPHEESPFL